MLSYVKLVTIFLLYSTINPVKSSPAITEVSSIRMKEVNAPENTTSFPRLQYEVPTIDGDSKCATNSTFCEDTDSYPYDHLKHLIDSKAMRNDFFSKENVEMDVINRQSPDDISFLCRSITQIVFPRMAKNKDKKWRFIVNQEDFLQGVRVELCYRPGLPCDFAELPPGYESICKQKYIDRKLVSLTDRGRPTPDMFPLPVACCCAYKRDFNYLKKFRPL